jgi:hypothetical protein
VLLLDNDETVPFCPENIIDVVSVDGLSMHLVRAVVLAHRLLTNYVFLVTFDWSYR